jgi:micrococcal nuclease
MNFLAIVLALALVSPAYSHEVIGIADGDTLTLLADKQPLKIRLANNDAPEKAHAFSQRSRQSSSDLCWEKDAQYRVQDIDRYGRTVAVVACGGVEVDRAQVERGMAWVYERYNKDRQLSALQAQAQKVGRGLWVDGERAIPPWEFRRAQHD